MFFDRFFLQVEISNTGETPPGRLNRLYCYFCEKKHLTKNVKEHKVWIY